MKTFKEYINEEHNSIKIIQGLGRDFSKGFFNSFKFNNEKDLETIIKAMLSDKEDIAELKNELNWTDKDIITYKKELNNILKNLPKYYSELKK